MGLITDRRQAEEALRESDERFRNLFDLSPDPVWIIDDHKFVDCNNAAVVMLGYPDKESLINTHPSELSPEFQPDGEASYSKAERMMFMAQENGLNRFEWVHRRFDKSNFYAEVTLSTIMLQGRKVIYCLWRDISARKDGEKQLQLQASALDAAANAIVITDVDGTIAWVNPAFINVSGYTFDEVKGQNPRILKSGNLDEAYYKTLWDTILSGQVWQGELINRRKDGSTYSELQTITPVMDEAGEITNFIAIKQDISERKLEQEARLASEERYRDLVENALDIIYTHDLDGNYTSANRAVEAVLGYTVEEAVTKNLDTTVAPEYVDVAKEMVSELLDGKEAVSSELEVFAKNGHRVAIEVKSRLIKENGLPVGVQGIARDITDRKQLEDQLRQAQKMESVGVLAGGIAHDFNNLLTAINGYSDLALRKMKADDPLRHNIKEVRDAGERAAELTSQLLIFSRKKILNPRVHNLNSTISNIEKMLGRILREDIELRAVLEPGLGNIKADSGQIEQIIMNLATNARDAMPNGGTLTIETQNDYLDEQYVKQHAWVSPGPFVRMTVTDTGVGMDYTTQRQIFEPFFTTKETGKGTGLGLSTVFGIVKQSGGHIMVYSEVGHGTTFKIYLPCVDEVVQEVKWVDHKEAQMGTETILLVEDEEIVRNLAREILTSNGYTVLEAANGKEALSICETYLEPIHLLLTDMIMPGISGAVLRDQLVELLPDIKVLFMSGYTDDSISSKGLLDSDAAFIEKPFTPDSLARRVRDVLAT